MTDPRTEAIKDVFFNVYYVFVAMLYKITTPPHSAWKYPTFSINRPAGKLRKVAGPAGTITCISLGPTAFLALNFLPPFGMHSKFSQAQKKTRDYVTSCGDFT